MVNTSSIELAFVGGGGIAVRHDKRVMDHYIINMNDIIELIPCTIHISSSAINNNIVVSSLLQRDTPVFGGGAVLYSGFTMHPFRPELHQPRAIAHRVTIDGNTTISHNTCVGGGHTLGGGLHAYLGYVTVIRDSYLFDNRVVTPVLPGIAAGKLSSTV